VSAIPKSANADRRRLEAWTLLDKKSDPRGAIIALRPLLEVDPSSFVGAALFEGAIDALRKMRNEAGAALATVTPMPVSDGAPSGKAPIERARAHTLKVVATKPLGSLVAMTNELRRASELLQDDFIAPAWIPDNIGTRHRDLEASSANGPYRAEVFKAYGSKSLVGVWRNDKVVSLLDVDRYVTFASAHGDVVFLTVNDEGKGYHLEARNTKSGNLYWRVENVDEQYSYFVDGYIVASTGARSPSDNGEAILIEADTGRIASRVGGGPFILFREKKGIRAINGVHALDLVID